MPRRIRIEAPGALRHILGVGWYNFGKAVNRVVRLFDMKRREILFPASVACNSPQPALLLDRKGTGDQYHVSCQQTWHARIKRQPKSTCFSTSRETHECMAVPKKLLAQDTRSYLDRMNF
jgi:hypothetical protein